MALLEKADARGRALDLAPLAADAIRAAQTYLSVCGGVLAVAAISRLAIVFVAYLSLTLVPAQIVSDVSGFPLSTHRTLNAAWSWDAGWYGTIIRHGYHVEGPFAATAAFWPLFPLLVKVFSLPFGEDSQHVLGVLIPLAAYFGALHYLFALVRQAWGQEVARRTVILLSIFPSAFFLNVAYPESLLLLAAVGAFWHARRAQWWRAGAWGMAAALAQVPGVLLSVPLVYEYARQRGFSFTRVRADAVSLLMPSVGLGLFMAHLYFVFGDPIAFVRASEIWDHRFVFPSVTLAESLRRIFTDPANNPMLIVNSMSFMGFLGAGIWWFFKREVAFGLWVLLVLALHLSIPPPEPLDSGVRYVLVLFPGFVALALATQRRWAFQAVAVPSLMLLGLYTSMYVTDHWVA